MQPEMRKSGKANHYSYLSQPKPHLILAIMCTEEINLNAAQCEISNENLL